MKFSEWQPAFMSPESNEHYALVFSKVVGTRLVMRKLAETALSGGMDAVSYWRIRSVVMPGNWEMERKLGDNPLLND